MTRQKITILHHGNHLNTGSNKAALNESGDGNRVKVENTVRASKADY